MSDVFESGLRESEGMRTEISTKFTLESAARMFDEIELRLLELYTDDKDLSGLALAAPQ